MPGQDMEDCLSHSQIKSCLHNIMSKENDLDELNKVISNIVSLILTKQF